MKEWSDLTYRKEVEMPRMTRRDLVKLLLLERYGGVWLDVDTIMLRDLSEIVRVGPGVVTENVSSHWYELYTPRDKADKGSFHADRNSSSMSPSRALVPVACSRLLFTRCQQQYSRGSWTRLGKCRSSHVGDCVSAPVRHGRTHREIPRSQPQR